MNDEIKELLGKALPPSPPTAMDGDTAVADGRRRLGRRRYAAGGGALAGVAAVAVTISLAMNTVGGNGGIPGVDVGASPSASASEDPGSGDPGEKLFRQLDPDGDGRMEVDMPVVDLPYMPDGTVGGWNPGFTGVDTAEAATYSDAFWAYLDQTYPGYEDLTAETMPEDINVAPGVRSVVRDHTAQLIEQVSETESRTMRYVMPIYILEFSQGGFSSPATVELPGAEHADGLGMEIYPVGGFTDGTDGIFDLAACEDYETPANGGRTLDHQLDCDESDGPNGELVRTVREDMTGSDGGWSVTLTSILYREDGTAVVVTDTVEDWEGAEVRDPELGFDDLTALAAAMPDTVVK